MKNSFIYRIIFIFFIFQGIAFSQTFNVSEVDASGFPKVFCSFTAYDILGNPYGVFNLNDFTIYDNGVKIPQSAMNLKCPDDLPISVVMVLDKSSSMDLIVDGYVKWDWVIDGAKAFIDNIILRGESQIAMTTFETFSKIICNFTKDKKELLDSMNNLPKQAYGGTNYNQAFLDKNTGALAVLKKSPITHRRVIVFLSDGKHDVMTGPLLSKDIIDSLRNSNIQLYAINLLSPPNAELQNICTNTAGKYYDVNSKPKLYDLYKNIAEDANLKMQCELSWITPDICDKSALVRKADITFLKGPILKTRKYIVPEVWIKRFTPDKDVYEFGNPLPNNYEESYITLTAENSDFNIQNIDIIPKSNFTIVDWGDGKGVKPTFPLIQSLHEVRNIKIRFTQSSPRKIQRATLVVTSDPCNLNLPLVGGIQQIVLEKPLENDLFSSCDNVKIEWSGVDSDVEVDLYYSIDGGKTWKLIVSKATGLKYNWGPTGLNSKVKVKAVVSSKTYYEWAKQFGGSNLDLGTSINVLNNDLYLYTCGSYSGSSNFGGQSLTSSGMIDFYLSKYDSDGNLIWAQTGGNSTHNDYANGVTSDGSGNAYIVGTTFKGLTFGKISPGLQEDDMEYCMVAKFSTSGTYVQSTFVGSYATYKNFKAYGNKIMIRQLPGDYPYVYVYGNYSGEYQDFMRGFNLPKKTSYPFTAVFDLNLDIVDLYPGGIDYPEYSTNKAIDNNQTVYTIGSFKAPISFGNINLTSRGDFDGYITKFSTLVSTTDSTKEFTISKPSLKFGDKSYDFGDLILGDSVKSNTKKYIVNDGLIPIKITNATISGPNMTHFTFLHNYINDTIKPGDSVDLDLQFKTSNLNKHQALLTLTGVCLNPITLDLFGNGICGGAALDTYKFGEQNLYKPKVDTLKCAFYNQSDFAVILGPKVRGADYLDFILSFPSYVSVTFGETVVLPNECLDLIVTFTPQAFGARNAYIDYFVKPPCKNVSTYLTGDGITSDVIVTSIDWGEKRVMGAYSDKITIKNNSSVEEKITAIEYENADTDNIFTFDVPSLPLTIPADTSIVINFKFNPKAQMAYENNIILTPVIKLGKLKANLKGVGILPIMNAEWICGNPVNLGDSTTAFLKLKNTSFSSELKINKIEFEKIGKEYKWQNGTITTDIVLNKDEERQFPVVYSPQIASDHKNKVLIYADDYDATFTNQWKITTVATSCDGLDIKAESPMDYLNLVICDNSILKTKVSNLSKQSDIQVYGTKATIIGKDMNSFKLLNKTDINLLSNNTFDYEIQFDPIRLGLHSAQLVIPNSTNNDLIIDLKGNGVNFTASTSVLNFEFDPGKTYTIPFIAQIPDLLKNGVDKISVSINYNQFDLNFEPKSIKSKISANSTQTEYLIWSQPDLSKNGLITFTGTGKLKDNQKVELFTMDFVALLTDIHESVLNYGFDYGCTNDLNKVADIKISEVCFNNNRILVSSGTSFILSDPNPNPISTSTVIEYSVGFDVFTEIELFNSLGELVSKPVSNFTSVGKYSIDLNTEKLTSGIYFMRMIAGPFSTVKRIIISK